MLDYTDLIGGPSATEKRVNKPLSHSTEHLGISVQEDTSSSTARPLQSNNDSFGYLPPLKIVRAILGRNKDTTVGRWFWPYPKNFLLRYQEQRMRKSFPGL